LALATFCESLVSGTGFDPGLDWDPIDFVYCWPSYVDQALDMRAEASSSDSVEKARKRARERSVEFFRKVSLLYV
jgi:hypothetical protein